MWPCFQEPAFITERRPIRRRLVFAESIERKEGQPVDADARAWWHPHEQHCFLHFYWLRDWVSRDHYISLFLRTIIGFALNVTVGAFFDISSDESTGLCNSTSGQNLCLSYRGWALDFKVHPRPGLNKNTLVQAKSGAEVHAHVHVVSHRNECHLLWWIWRQSSLQDGHLQASLDNFQRVPVRHGVLLLRRVEASFHWTRSDYFRHRDEVRFKDDPVDPSVGIQARPTQRLCDSQLHSSHWELRWGSQCLLVQGVWRISAGTYLRPGGQRWPVSAEWQSKSVWVQSANREPESSSQGDLLLCRCRVRTNIPWKRDHAGSQQ